MSSYNNNLRNVVVASLKDQELDIKQEFSQQNAATFTLFYAAGATITAEEKLREAEADQHDKARLKLLTDESGNISRSLLMAATQADNFVKRSQTNSAVCAANIQVAANAIVRLASDVGSIYSIINAADLGSNMYDEAEVVYNLMNATALAAEVASNTAMEASFNIAEVASSATLTKSKDTNAGMNKMIAAVSAGYTSSAQAVASKDDVRAAARAAEKDTESNFNDFVIDYVAASGVYYTMNKELNLDLIVNVTDNEPSSPKKTALRITFDKLKNPFPNDLSINSGLNDLLNNKAESSVAASLQSHPKAGNQPDLTLKIVDASPVSEYLIFFVKDESKYVFSIEVAEKIRETNPDPVVNPKTSNGKFPYICLNKSIDIRAAAPEVKNKSKSLKGMSCIIEDIKSVAANYFDSDGDPLAMGQKYVVFVMANYDEKYKKLLNDFNDYLSAPSPTFVIADYLPAAADASFQSGKREMVTFRGRESVQTAPNPLTGTTSTIRINYRVMFLPIIKIDQSVGLVPCLHVTELLNGGNKVNQGTGGVLPFVPNLPYVFNVALAQQVAAGNYLPTNRPKVGQKHVAGAADDGTIKMNYEVKIQENTTDIFGNPIMSGTNYQVIVLSTCYSPDQTVNDSFIDVLSTPISITYQSSKSLK